MKVVVIGVGNPWRRDDGAGWAVLDAIGTRLAGRAELVRTDGEPSRLIEAWTGADLAVLVDAVRTGSRAGMAYRFEVGEGTLGPSPATSSHGLGVKEAVQLGNVLDRLPRRLVLFGIEGEAYRDGPAPSTIVAGAVEQVADCVVGTVTEALAAR